jgi:hypothetical protein
MTRHFKKPAHSLYECEYHIVFCPKYRYVQVPSRPHFPLLIARQPQCLWHPPEVVRNDRRFSVRFMSQWM